jgi:hypothetical protein
MIGTRVAFRGAFGPHEGIVLGETEDSVNPQGGKERHAGQPRPSDDLENKFAAAFDSGRGVALQRAPLRLSGDVDAWIAGST